MCGIAGFWGRGDQSDVAQMVQSLRHRGPDDEGYWHDATLQIHLGHRRLSIVDLRDGAQPMVSADGSLAITYNGEIYNHRELRKQLERRGHRFLTDHSDTEVILMGYREWGAEVVHRLNGMWAFAIVDLQNRRLLLSRDRFGEKPLYYIAKPRFLAFASELDALLLHRSVEGSLSIRGLKKYYGYGYVPAPTTLIEGVSKLAAGSSLTLDLHKGDVSVSAYWRYELEPSAEGQDIREAGEGLLEHLHRAVAVRMIADVDVGVLLSGGIDSAAIARLAAQSSGPIQTFNLGFTDPSFDESAFARLAAQDIGSVHRSEVLDGDKALLDLPLIAHSLDEPLGDSSILPTWHVSRFARRHVKVVLSGDGGDELLAGYDPIAALGASRALRNLAPKSIHEGLSMLAAAAPVTHRYMSLGFKAKRWLQGVKYRSNLWLPMWMAPLTPEDLGALLGEVIDPEDVYEEAIVAWERSSQRDMVDRATQFFVDIYLASDILTKTDRATMMHGLEARAPFLDINLVNFVRRLPRQFKYSNGKRKKVLKVALSGLVRSEILNRRKHGFSIPAGRWFKDGLLDVQPDRRIPGSHQVVMQRLKSHASGLSDERLFLWSYWMLANSALLQPKSTQQVRATS